MFMFYIYLLRQTVQKTASATPPPLQCASCIPSSYTQHRLTAKPAIQQPCLPTIKHLSKCCSWCVFIVRSVTVWRLTTHIWVVPHRQPPNVAFYIFIQQIQVLNILNMLYTLRFFSLQNAVCFIMLNCLVPVLFTFYIQDVLKLKK